VATRDQPAVLGQAYTGLASALADQGRYAEAALAFGRARVPLVLAGDTLALARVDANEGMLERLRGRPEVALPLLQRAVGVFERFGALNELFVTVAAEVEAHLLLLDPQAALATSTPRYRERQRLANASNRDYLALHHARALAAAGRSAQARQLLEELDRAAPSEPPLRPGVAAALAELELEAGNVAAASRWAGMAVDALDQEAWRLRARTWLIRVRALHAQGELAAARREALALDQWAGEHPEFAFIGVLARLAAAELAAAAGQRVQALEHYAKAQAGAEAWGVPADVVLVALSHAQALIAFGAAEQASDVAGRVLRWADRDYGIALLQARLYQALGQESARDASLARARELAGERPVPALAEPRPAMAQGIGVGD
jgi:tetratricopeptide (TPR) repeat protein